MNRRATAVFGALLLLLAASRSQANDLAEVKRAGLLVEGFARLHKVRIEIHAVKRWEDRIPQLLKNEGDLVIGLVETPARREQLAFTSEVMPARHVVVTHKPKPAVATVEQFRSEKVGVVKATSWAQAAYDAGVPAVKTEAYATTEEMLEALRSQRIGASVMSLSDLTLAMRRYPGLQAGATLGEPASAGWGLRKEDKALQAALDEYLANARKGSSWSRLVVKYFGDQALTALGK